MNTTMIPPIALRTSNRQEMEEYIQNHYDSLLRTSRRILKNESDAEEAVQEGLLAATRGLSRFRGDAKLSTWLHTVVRNAALWVRRVRSRQEPSIQDLLSTDTDDNRLAVAEDGHDPIDGLVRVEDETRLREALTTLSDTNRQLIEWRDFEGTASHEIGARLGIRRGAVRVRVHRARAALKEAFANQDFLARGTPLPRAA